MDKSQAVYVLKSAEAQVRELGASSMYLFGSFTRDEDKSHSDINVFVDRDPSIPFGMMQITGLQTLLEDLLGRAVGVGTRESLHPAIRSEVEREAIQIFYVCTKLDRSCPFMEPVNDAPLEHARRATSHHLAPPC